VTDVNVAVLVGMCVYVCMCLTLVHPGKAVRSNEMQFGRDTCVVPSNIVLDRALILHGKGRFGGRNPQFAAMPPIVKQGW